MSHFTVLVIGNNPEEQLAPFHEFECTGEEEFIQEIDELDEYEKKYETETRKMVRFIGNSKVLCTEDAKTVRSTSDDFFFREPTAEEMKERRLSGTGWGPNGFHWVSKDWGDGKGYCTRVQDIPPDWQEVDIPIKEIMTFFEFVTDYCGHGEVISTFQEPDTIGPHKYGWVRVDENNEVLEVVRRTNPNAKWDWYVLGGRWSGFFKLKSEDLLRGLPWRNEPGLVAIGSGPEASNLIGDYADRARVGEIDVQGMREDARKEAEKSFDAYYDVIQHFPDALSFSQVREKFTDPSEARKFYNNQKAIKALHERKIGAWGCAIETFGRDRDVYVQECANSALSTFAVLKDGIWHEKGKMGWWACVSDETSDSEWNEQLNRLFDDLSPDTVVSLYDCHI